MEAPKDWNKNMIDTINIISKQKRDDCMIIGSKSWASFDEEVM